MMAPMDSRNASPRASSRFKRACLVVVASVAGLKLLSALGHGLGAAESPARALATFVGIPLALYAAVGVVRSRRVSASLLRLAAGSLAVAVGAVLVIGSVLVVVSASGTTSDLARPDVATLWTLGGLAVILSGGLFGLWCAANVLWDADHDPPQ